MNLENLERLRMNGQRPRHGLVLVRDRLTRAQDPVLGQVVTDHRGAVADWGAVHGLAVDVHLSTWEPWVLAVLERITSARPLALTVWDPVSGVPIYMIRGGEAHEPLAIDPVVWDRPAREALRA